MQENFWVWEASLGNALVCAVVVFVMLCVFGATERRRRAQIADLKSELDAIGDTVQQIRKRLNGTM